jgi:hypothetical protein
LVVPLVLVAGLAAGCSSGSSALAAVVASGSVSCTTVSGAVSFSPPLTTSGKDAETTSISVTASGCTTAGSNVTSVTKGVGSATISSPTNACSGLLTSRPLSIKVAWTPATTRPSVVTYSGYEVTSAGGHGGFTLPSPGGTAKVTGSFAGSDGGAGSTAVTVSSQGTTQLVAECGSSAGLASIPVTSGSLTLK